MFINPNSSLNNQQTTNSEHNARPIYGPPFIDFVKTQMKDQKEKPYLFDIDNCLAQGESWEQLKESEKIFLEKI